MNQSIYIYGIVNEPALAASFAETDPDIYAVSSMGCSAIVANRPAGDLGELDRESLARMLLQHQQTLERLMESGMQLIPLKLGTFVSSAAEAAAIIEDGYNLIERIFRETEDAHELEVVVKWSSFADLLQEVVSEDDVQELKRDIEARQSSSTEDAVAVGRLIKEKIDQRNAAVSASVLGQLGERASQSKRHETMDDEMVLNAAFLVKRAEVDAFVATVEALDSQYQNVLYFRIVGPLPCYSFYTLEVTALFEEFIAEKRAVLGLDARSLEADVKKAYHAKAKVAHPDGQMPAGANNGADFTVLNEAYMTLHDYYSALRNSASSRHGHEGQDSGNVVFSVKILN
jgi:hypothetical protein